jgi:signal transduction histidine kinase
MIDDRLTLGRGAHVAWAATLLYGVFGAAVRDQAVRSPATLVLLIVSSAAILALATRTALIMRVGFTVYLVVQTALITACMVLSHGVVTLHYLLPISQATLVWPRRAVATLCVAFAAQHLCFGIYFVGWGTAGIELIGFGAVCVFVVVVTEIVAAERRARTALAAAHRELAGYAASVEELATVQERNRLAREVHDSVGHYLTVINVQLEAAARLIESEPHRAAAAVARARNLTGEGLDDIRRSVAALRAAPYQDRPLPEAIAALVSELATSGTAAELRVHGEPRALAPAASLTLFRAAQEALTNVRKHARASRADVELSYAASTVELAVADDGCGTADPTGGFGLLGVRERVHLLGGKLDIASAPDAGFRLRVEVPG